MTAFITFSVIGILFFSRGHEQCIFHFDRLRFGVLFSVLRGVHASQRQVSLQLHESDRSCVTRFNRRKELFDLGCLIGISRGSQRRLRRVDHDCDKLSLFVDIHFVELRERRGRERRRQAQNHYSHYKDNEPWCETEAS
jgi:hypothetical protein